MMRLIVVAALLAAACCSSANAEAIFSDFFSTDPFAAAAPRWAEKSFHYGFYWTGGNWDPGHDVNLGGPASNLPLADGNTLAAFSTGTTTVGSVDQTEVAGDYVVSFDFCVKYSGAPVGNFNLAQRINRQKDERDYSAGLQVGSDGAAAWTGAYPQTSATTLRPGVWYKFITTVANASAEVRFSSEIRLAADDSLVASSPVFTDTAPERLSNTYGWGWRLVLTDEGYWSRTVEIDNFTVNRPPDKSVGPTSPGAGATAPSVGATAPQPPDKSVGPTAPGGAFDVSTPTVTIPRIASPPTIDGIVQDSEWDYAAVLEGFTLLDAGTAPIELTRAWLGYDAERLYVAVRCWMQPGARPRSEVKGEGGAVWNDDCVELFFDPLRKGGEYHFVGNSISATYSSPNVPWEWKSRQTGTLWEGEMSIPWASLEAQPPKPGEEWGMLLGRTVQVPDQRYSQWAGQVAATWHTPSLFGRLRFGDTPPLVNLGPLDASGVEIRLGGEIQAPPADSSLRLRTRVMKVQPPTPAGKDESGVMVFHQDVAEKVSESDTSVELPGGTRRKLAAPEFPSEAGLYRYEIEAAGGDGKVVFAQRVPLVRVEPISVAVRRFPTIGLVEMDADLTRSPAAAQIARTACEIRDLDGKQLWRDEATGIKPSFRFTGYGKLTPGDYKLIAAGLDASGAVLATKEIPFVKAPPPPWLNNDLGKEDKIVAPWTPMQVKGNSVEIWGRRYEFGKDGLPAQITAAGQPLLKSPWKLVAETAGGPLRFTPGKSGLKVTRLSDTKATVTAESKANGWTMRVNTTVEFDGFAWSEITLTPPANGSLRCLWLDLQVDKKYAKYRLPVFNDPVAIPAEGLATSVIASTDWPNQTTIGLTWIGDEDRGLVFQAEHAANWNPIDRKHEITLTPEGDSWIWRCHLQDNEGPFTTPQTYGFAWQASPVKPLVNAYGTRAVGDGWYPSTTPPPAKEMDTFFAGAEALGVKEAHTHEPWTEIMGYPFSFLNMDQVKTATTAARAHGVRNCLYSHPVLSTLAPEYTEWGAEFSLKDPPVAAFQRTPPQDIHFICHDTPWTDFYIWGWVRLIKEYGVGGMYFDGTYGAAACINPNHAHAQKYADGTQAPVQPIRAARMFMLRLRRATQAADPGFFFLGHGGGPGSAAFLDYFMSGENFWVAPANFEVPLDYMRVIFSPQWGIPREFYRGPILQQPYIRPIALAHGYGMWTSGDYAGTETEIWHLPIWKAWTNFGIQDAEFVPYWKNSPLVTSSNPDVIVSFHRKSESVLVAAATTKRQQPTAVITVDLKALGLDSKKLEITSGDGIPIPNLPAPDADGKLRLAFPEAMSQGVYLWLRNKVE